MKQYIGNKINQIQIDNKPDFFGQKIIQRGSILEYYIYAQFRFGNFGFGSVNLTEISVSVVSVFTRFGRPLNFGETPIALALQGYHIWIVLLLRIRAFLRMISKLEQIYNFLKLNQYWDYFMLLFSFLILYLLDHLPWYMSCNERM